MEHYDPKDIEPKWQKRWGDDGLYKTEEEKDKQKYYILDMFPYPSGEGLHVGHPKGYIATDIFARAKMMAGFRNIFSNAYRKMLFFLFFMKKYNAPIKSIDTYGNIRMLFNILPSLLHTFAPIDVIKDKNRIIMNML